MTVVSVKSTASAAFVVAEVNVAAEVLVWEDSAIEEEAAVTAGMGVVVVSMGVEDTVTAEAGGAAEGPDAAFPRAAADAAASVLDAAATVAAAGTGGFTEIIFGGSINRTASTLTAFSSAGCACSCSEAAGRGDLALPSGGEAWAVRRPRRRALFLLRLPGVEGGEEGPSLFRGELRPASGDACGMALAHDCCPRGPCL